MISPNKIEIDFSILKNNIKILKKDIPKNLKLCCVVKDNAYGHDACHMVNFLTLYLKPNMFAVARVEEAFNIQPYVQNIPIIILGEPTKESISHCIDKGYIFILSSLWQAQYANQLSIKLGKVAKCHINIDTGLGRFGIQYDQFIDFFNQVLALLNISVSGLMTHFAQSDANSKMYAYEQLNRFKHCLSKIPSFIAQHKPTIHACNSGGYLDLPDAHFNMVRLGVLLYGLHPSKSCRQINELHPILSLKSKICSIKKFLPGDCIGYGMHYKVKEKKTIAAIPLGYGQGYPRIRNVGHVLVHGQKAGIVGGNSMDASMIDVTHIPNLQLDDEVILVGQQGNEIISFDDLATWENTVSYNIMTRLGHGPIEKSFINDKHCKNMTNHHKTIKEISYG
ncbi:alanine racemase [bacterium]|nr:alanine racemase [bacterium]